MPLLLAAEALTKKRKGNGKIHLVFFGYFTGDSFREDYAKAADSICETAHVTFIENHDARFPDALWAGADIFVSLVDNIQESFGLTPIEAMACGLPVLVTDWDGYRDTVRDGVDGFLVPTLAPPPAAVRNLSDAISRAKTSTASILRGQANRSPWMSRRRWRISSAWSRHRRCAAKWALPRRPVSVRSMTGSRSFPLTKIYGES